MHGPVLDRASASTNELAVRAEEAAILFDGNSLKTRVTIITFAIFLLGSWSLSLFVSHLQERDLEQMLSRQQFSLVTLLAKSIDQELGGRLEALERVATVAEPAMRRGPAAMQDYIESRPVFQFLFNGGVVAYDPRGRVVARVEYNDQRHGTHRRDSELIARVVATGQVFIGDVFMDENDSAPTVAMAAPVRDGQGGVNGVIVGWIDLGRPNFLTDAMTTPFGISGGYLLIDRVGRQIIAATDSRRVMEKLPVPGAHPIIDRFLDGHDGTAILINPHGQEMLVADKGIRSAGWIVSVVLPTQEAFAPIAAMKSRLLTMTLFLTLLAAALTWWFMRRQFAPLDSSLRSLSVMRQPGQPLQPLAVGRQDEIGQLIQGFNSLIEVVEEREAALRDAERKFLALVQQSLVGVYIIRDGRWAYVNPRMAQMFGYASPAACLAECDVNEAVAPESRALVAENLRRRLSGEIAGLNYDFTALRKDGTRFQVEVFGNFIEFEGRPAVMGVAMDISERKRASAELERHRFHLEELVLERTRELAEARDRAESASRAKSAFLANMSHELRTPLNHIGGFAALLRRDVQSPEGREHLAWLQKSSDQLLVLINELLDYSRLEAGEIAIGETDVDLAGLLDRAFAPHGELAAGKGIALVRQISHGLPAVVRGDAARLAQVLGHLLGNAVKFSEHGTVSLQVSRDDSGPTPMLKFVVQDEGIGIAQDLRPGLFKLFNQGDESSTRRFGGTGLGLALCKRLVKLMAGEIGYASVPGEGSAFWFVVPLILPSTPPAVEGLPAPAREPASPREIEHFAALLAQGDLEAKDVWVRIRENLPPALQEQAAAIGEAIAGFDFETASSLLQAAWKESGQGAGERAER